LVDNLRPQEYAVKLLHIREQYAKKSWHSRERGSVRICPLAVADEVTCIAMLKHLRAYKGEADLIFPLATGESVVSKKTELPEFMFSILVNRDEQRIYDYIRDAFWQILQTDVQLLAREYVRLFKRLEMFANECLPEKYEDRIKVSRKWAEYTLRLNAEFLDLYIDRDLPWKPILNRAIRIMENDMTSKQIR
jgi:hypothetical protein